MKTTDESARLRCIEQARKLAANMWASLLVAKQSGESTFDVNTLVAYATKTCKEIYELLAPYVEEDTELLDENWAALLAEYLRDFEEEEAREENYRRAGGSYA